MSESEQSWSYGGESSKLKLGYLLVGAMAMIKPKERWPMDNRSFALAVDKEKERGSTLAGRIPVYNGVAGRHCPDFDGALSYALHACLIEYLSPSYTQMVLNAGPRTVRQLLRDVLEEEINEAKALVQAFWDIAHGIEAS